MHAKDFKISVRNILYDYIRGFIFENLVNFYLCFA